MDINSVTSSNSATDRGTKIEKDGNSLDKNAFLKILTAEMSNQDPTQQQDSTQYIAQLAQFSSLEQMTNLNTNVTFSGAASLIGKTVALDKVDQLGNQYVGVVKGISKDGSNINLGVEVTENGTKTIETFSYSDVSDIIDG